MGTAQTPYQDLRTAKRFSAKLKKPWFAKLSIELATDVSALISDDDLYDMLADDIAAHCRKLAALRTFDLRPTIMERVKTMVHDEALMLSLTGQFLNLNTDDKAMNIVRKALHLAPLARPSPAETAAARAKYKFAKLPRWLQFQIPIIALYGVPLKKLVRVPSHQRLLQQRVNAFKRANPAAFAK